MSFQIADRRLSGNLQIIAPEGDGDLLSAPQLRQHVSDAIRGGATGLVFDLSESTFIDSTVLAVLVSAFRSSQTTGGGLAVVCPDSRMRGIFEITGLARLFPVVATLEQADLALRLDLRDPFE